MLSSISQNNQLARQPKTVHAVIFFSSKDAVLKFSKWNPDNKSNIVLTQTADAEAIN